MTYRVIDEQDAPQLRVFWEGIPGLGLGDSDEPERLAVFFRRNPELSWGCFDGDTLVATVLAGHDGRRGFLYHLAVTPKHRGNGLATGLMSRALDGLSRCGIFKAHVFVLADNPSGLAFWAAAAREGWGRRGDLLVFSKSL